MSSRKIRLLLWSGCLAGVVLFAGDMLFYGGWLFDPDKLGAGATTGEARKLTTDLKDLHRRYMEASIRHDLKTLSAMMADDIVWKLGPWTFMGKKQALGPNGYDAGMETKLEYSHVIIKGDTVEFELIERNDELRAVGCGELHHYPRFVFEDGLVKRIESWKATEATPGFEECARRDEIFLKWVRENHPEAVAILWDSKNKPIFSRETGALTRKLANEWKVRKIP